MTRFLKGAAAFGCIGFGCFATMLIQYGFNTVLLAGMALAAIDAILATVINKEVTSCEE